MIHKTLTLTAAAMVAAGLGLGTVQAATMTTLPTPLPAFQTSDAPTLDLAAWRRWHGGGWHDGWHDHGYWGPGIGVGLGLGLGLATAPYAYGGGGYAYAGNAHVQWCLNHYRTYDPRSNTYIGNDGYRHTCGGY